MAMTTSIIQGISPWLRQFMAIHFPGEGFTIEYLMESQDVVMSFRGCKHTVLNRADIGVDGWDAATMTRLKDFVDRLKRPRGTHMRHRAALRLMQALRITEGNGRRFQKLYGAVLAKGSYLRPAATKRGSKGLSIGAWGPENADTVGGIIFIKGV